MKRIAIPCENGRVVPHFGHAPQFAVLDVDPQSGRIDSETVLDAPPHEPGALPRWLAEQKVNVVLAGGMGGRAQQLLGSQGIEVVTGVAGDDARAVATAYVAGNLATAGNACSHGSAAQRPGGGCAHDGRDS